MITAKEAEDMLMKAVDVELETVYDLITKAAPTERHIYVKSDFWSYQSHTEKWQVACAKLKSLNFDVTYNYSNPGIKISW